MITHQCEACGNSEYVEVNKTSMGASTTDGKLCDTCSTAYHQLVERVEAELRATRKDKLDELKENMVTEARRERGIEPFDQEFEISQGGALRKRVGSRTLHELVDNWLNKVDKSKRYNHDIRAMHHFMLEVANVLEGPSV